MRRTLVDLAVWLEHPGREILRPESELSGWFDRIAARPSFPTTAPNDHIRDAPVRARVNSTAYRSAIGVALAAAFLLVWLSLGVGIIGADGDPANLMYFGVLAVGIAGAIIARLRPHGMARALFAMALAQALVAAIALIARLGLPWSPPAEILALNGFFIALFAGAAWLFRRAAREQSERPISGGAGGA